MNVYTNTMKSHDMSHMAILFLAMLTLLLTGFVHASEVSLTDTSDAGGQVTLPLDEYQRLLAQVTTLPLSAPSAYAIGQSVLSVVFQQRDGHVTATVQAQVDIETFEDEWTLVALLSPGAALESASINNVPVQLVQRAEGLFWLAEKRQKASLQLTYHVDSRFADRAYITSLPIPRAAATRFSLNIPQTHIDLVVAPVANLLTSEHDTNTTATGTLPTTQAMMVSWRVAVEREYVLTHADYTGVIQSATQISARDTAIAWHASIAAEMLIDGEVTVPLISTATTLVAVEVGI